MLVMILSHLVTCHAYKYFENLFHSELCMSLYIVQIKYCKYTMHCVPVEEAKFVNVIHSQSQKMLLTDKYLFKMRCWYIY